MTSLNGQMNYFYEINGIQGITVLRRGSFYFLSVVRDNLETGKGTGRIQKRLWAERDAVLWRHASMNFNLKMNLWEYWK